MLPDKIINNLKCPDCLISLEYLEHCFSCPGCHRQYPIVEAVVNFSQFSPKDSAVSADNLISRLKNIFKKYSIFYNFLYYAFGGLFVGLSAKRAIKNLGSDKLILNLGSGIKRIRPDVINVDFLPFKNVDIVADITHLPFADNSIDAVINEFVLEHVKNPATIIAEIKRVLKPGGLLYLTAPFVEGFHSSPHDYQRWTKTGLQNLMRDFQLTKIGVRSGPTSALLSILTEWLAVLLSFGWRPLQQIWLMFFLVVTAPLKLLDYLMCHLPNAENISYAFYYLGRKK